MARPRKNKFATGTETESASSSSKTSGSPIADFIARLEAAKQLREELKSHDERIANAQAQLDAAKALCATESSRVDEAEASILADYPEAASFLGRAPVVVVAKRRGRKPGSGSAPKAPSSQGLSLEQAETVLDALGNTFTLAQFRHKTAELFDGLPSKGGIDLLATRVRNAGGKGMGTKFKKN